MRGRTITIDAVLISILISTAASSYTADCSGDMNKCLKCSHDTSGHPETIEYCSHDPCPPPVCCSLDEETCYDENNTAVSCASLGSIGCPCPENQMRCGNTTHSFGWCDAICCDLASEEVCTDEEDNHYCAPVGKCTQTRHTNLRAQAYA